jgi:AcrR family transcriptional regulator
LTVPSGKQAPGANGVGRSGRVAVGRGQVGEIQRARIMSAMAELVRERGAAQVTVAHVVERSGVSRRTFYELFEDREDCLLAAFDHAVARAAGAVLPEYRAAVEEGPGEGAPDAGARNGSRAASPHPRDRAALWQERVRAGLAALLGFLDREPAVGGLCVVDGLAAGPAVLERRARVVEVLVGVVHEGARVRSGSGRRPERLVAEGVVGAVLAVIHARLLEPRARSFTSLLNPLMAIVLLPYLGPDVAEREQTRSTPRRRRPPRQASDPLRDLDMRLTYRTVRVLQAVAEHPATSSRKIADASGVCDQGQISKLLWRLEHLGLIANSTDRHGKGEPNAWTLTLKGGEIEQAIRRQTSG